MFHRCSYVEFLGTDHYFFDAGVGQFPKKAVAAQHKRLENSYKKRRGKKNQASAFCEPDSVFDFKRNILKAIQVQPKGDENISCPNCQTPTLKKNNGPPLTGLFDIVVWLVQCFTLNWLYERL